IAAKAAKLLPISAHRLGNSVTNHYRRLLIASSATIAAAATAVVMSDRGRAKLHGAFGTSYDPKHRDEFLSMPLEERRKQYSCGENYTPMVDIPTWAQQAGAAKQPNDGDPLARRVSLHVGDITKLEIDAIVNAANSSLLGGGGVDGAIHRAAGPLLKAECAQLKGCETGDAKATCGYKLPARYVLHTVGPMGSGDKALRSCYSRCLELARQHGLTSVAFPCISTGVYGFPAERAAKIALETVRDFLANDKYGEKIERIIFCVFLDADYRLYTQLLPEYFPTKRLPTKKQKEEQEAAAETSAPAGETSAPAGETPAPAGETSAPAGETSAPAGETSAPAGETSAPAGETSAPAGETSAPAGETSAPAGETSAPAGETSAPAGETPATAGDTTQPAT
ncbi:hypothetical protein BOX15_Mlig005005g1, partial [Macrostomum lignano]